MMKLLVLASLFITGWAANISPECLRKCPLNYAPICGEDGVTYANDCNLKAAECIAKKQIKVLHKGECNVGGSHKKPRASLHNEADDCMKPCPRNYDPVCGSDGKTYSNECVFETLACQKKQSITIVHKGRCEQIKETLKARQFKADPCRKGCPDNLDPVCGSDGQTYPNMCEMEVGACEKKQAIKVVHEGSCIQKKDILIEPVHKPDPCAIPCTDDYRPVCGADGKTYPNRCALEINECVTMTAIKVIYSGPCI